MLALAVGHTRANEGSDRLEEKVIQHPPSPCKEICKLNTAVDVCTGCGRTIGEIADWGSATASRQHEIIRRSSARLKSMASLPSLKV